MNGDSLPNDSALGLKLFLSTHPRFCRWSENTTQKLESVATSVYRSEGSYVQHAGETVGAVFVLAHGIIEAFSTINTGEEHLLAFLHPGSVLGLTGAFLQETPLRRQNWVAHTPVKLWRIPIRDFKDCFFEDREVADSVLHSMSARIQWLMDEAASLAILPAQCMVIRCLLGMNAPPEPMMARENGAVFKLTQAKLGLMLGLTRQTVRVVLRDLEVRGLVRIERCNIRVLSYPALSAYGAECGAARLSPSP